jgi:hypothetical protein
MSAYVLRQEHIQLLTAATDAMLRMNKKYPGSYPLHPDTVNIIGKYTNDLHNIYRALYIANIKAVNGRYGEDEKTLPKYTKVRPWDTERLNPADMRKAAETFESYMYQCSEEPIYGTPIFNAFYDVYKLLCLVLFLKSGRQ